MPVPRRSVDDRPAQHTEARAGKRANTLTPRDGSGNTGGSAHPDPSGPETTGPAMTAPARRVPLGLLLRLLVGLGLPALLAIRVGAGGVVEALGAITAPTVLAALALGAVTTVAGAARWCVVARGVGLDLSLRTATADAYRATLLNSLLPAGVLGDVHRAVRHHRPGDARGARAVVIERVAGQVVVVAVGVVVLVASPALLHALVGPGLGVVAGGLGVAVLVAGLWVRHARRAARVRVALASAGRDVREGLARVRTGPPVLLCSLVALGGLLALFVLAARVAGVGVSLGQLLPLVTVALLAMAVPLTVGGWGPREAAAAVAFAAVGLDAAQGLATAVVYGVLALIACLPGAVVLLADALGRPAGLPARPWSPSSARVGVRPTPAG
ncbi:lysylphosphatidylglycerol synthase transmembrane domain-containing protein [Actinomycetospora straminea]|uniref:lysylphosphatidylglycerol synthase transmembrane domain-containing protein n=1 Tax=Actinomycetospora straminea TaxID=663607 RepID=UPI002365A222|nr:lysylphosphatidylglycerol synthase transmembrane domain-containing protein [Actinomycetospora straminea]MDD7931060.1 lysylphosphatidylglycerol synthase transmembrane domain-containing protein [Actinomycetospora straminea]